MSMPIRLCSIALCSVALCSIACRTSPSKSPERPLSYFVGEWEGEYRGTQAFGLLVVEPDGRFQFSVTAGPEPEQRCELAGVLTVEGTILDLRVEDPPACASWGEATLGKQQLLVSSKDAFAIGDVEYLEAIVRKGRQYDGPVWALERR
jgi:hypothetical protein